MDKSGLTKRALDGWDSAAFSSIFLASSFSCSQALSTPAHTQVTQTVEPKMYVTWIEKIALGYESRYNWLTPKPRPEFRGGFVLLHINGIAIDPAAPFA